MKIKVLYLKIENVGETLTYVSAKDDTGRLRADLITGWWDEVAAFVRDLFNYAESVVMESESCKPSN